MGVCISRAFEFQRRVPRRRNYIDGPRESYTPTFAYVYNVVYRFCGRMGVYLYGVLAHIQCIMQVSRHTRLRLHMYRCISIHAAGTRCFWICVTRASKFELAQDVMRSNVESYFYMLSWRLCILYTIYSDFIYTIHNVSGF